MTEQIRKLESSENVNYNEAPANTNLDRSAKKAREAREKRENVANKPANVNWENGIYEWGWKNDRPDGEWKFNSPDSVYTWKFENGNFDRWVIENKKLAKKYNVHKNVMWDYVWTCFQGWKNYEGKWDTKMNLKEITYKNVNLKFSMNSLVNKNGDKLPIEKWFDTWKTGMVVAAMINAVQYSWKQLDYFEAEFTRMMGKAVQDTVQADYLGTPRDTDLVNNCKKLTWVSAPDLVKWLNKSRRDFGI